eukprot:2320122-Ditylum_brightwellii.AAC.1
MTETSQAGKSSQPISKELKKVARRERSSSFSRPPKQPTEAQSDPETSEPTDLTQPYARVESNQK